MAITTIAPAARKSTVRTTRRPVTAARLMAAPAKRAKRAPRDFGTRVDMRLLTTTTAAIGAGTTHCCVIVMIQLQMRLSCAGDAYPCAADRQTRYYGPE